MRVLAIERLRKWDEDWMANVTNICYNTINVIKFKS